MNFLTTIYKRRDSAWGSIQERFPYLRSMTIRKFAALIFGFLAFLVVAAIDWATPPISLVLLQLLPVLFVTWHAGIKWGISLSIAMTAVDIAIRIDNGSWSASALMYLDVASDFVAIMIIVWLQTLLKRSYELAHKSAIHDGLTKTLNRTGFYSVLQIERDRSRRYGGKPFSLAFIDCDNFKYVNDSLGHHVGDALLLQIAHVATHNLRKVDSVCRIGGDEFALLLPECDESSANAAMTHLKAELDKAMRAHNWPVGFSIGIAIFAAPTQEVHKIIELADGLMYEAKKTGKNCMVFRTF